MNQLILNLNADIRVLLTSYGASELNRVLNTDTYKETNIYRTQLWDLFHEFSNCYLYNNNNEYLFRDNQIKISFSMEQNDIILNMNTTVEVALTETGADILNKYNNRLNVNGEEHYKKFGHHMPKEYKLKTNYKANNVYKAELWVIMEIFGPHFHMGCDIAFVNNNIKIKFD